MKTGSRINTADWSTINLAELAKLPVVELKAGYRLQDDSGNGCAGDPPGFPTYFTRCVYNSQGNDPGSGPAMVIAHGGKLYEVQNAKWPAGKNWDQVKEEQHALMLRLWNRLPIDHPRTVAWIRATFAHHKHCYQVPELVKAGKHWSDAMLIWPCRHFADTPFGHFRWLEFEIEQAEKNRDFNRWTDAHKAAFIKEIEQSNAHIKAACEVVAVPDNHDGTIIIRRYYPEFQPTAELIAAEFNHPGNWWETLSTRPTADQCPGQYGHAHPVNGSWCQLCGWHEDRKAA